MGRSWFAAIIGIFFLSLVLPRFAFAYHNSFQSFYDWGPWYKTSKQHVLASSTSSAASNQKEAIIAEASKEVIKSPTGLLPNNPLYLLKPLTENIGLFFMFDPKAKIERELVISEERLAEVQFLLEQQKGKNVGKVLDSYEKLISDVANHLTTLKKDDAGKQLAKRIEKESAKQSIFLEKVELIVPDDTKDNVDQAIAKSKKTMDTTADMLNRDPLPLDMKARIESLNAIGVISDAQASALFAIDSRSKARERMESLASQQVLPLSDLRRLDEAQLGYYPDDYYALAEIKKIYEFKALLDNAPDEPIRSRLAEFGSGYKSGDPIPPDLKPWWLREQRLQELQFTLRPDLFVNSIIPKDAQGYKAIENIVNSFRPTAQQLQTVDTWVKENPNKIPPPEISRIVGLATNLGTPVAWTPPANMGEVQKANRQMLHPYCLDSPTRAKHVTTGEIKTFPTTCLPPNWWHTYSTDNVYKNPLTGEESIPVNTTAPHVAVPSCGMGVCKVQTCESGWFDKNGSFSDGCESDTP